ncbi:response regulator [Bacteroides sp.]
METGNYEILIIDDHPIVLEGIKKIASTLEGVKCDGILEVEKLENSFSSRPPYDMYILDLEFPKADGFSVIKSLRDKAPDSRILIYTMHEEPWMLAKLINADIDGLVSKNADLSELQKAISALQNGDTYFNATFLDMIQRGQNFYIEPEGKGPNLSCREKEILAYIVKGFSNKEISGLIYISENTIKTYRKRLMVKIGAKNAADLAFKGKNLI